MSLSLTLHGHDKAALRTQVCAQVDDGADTLPQGVDINALKEDLSRLARDMATMHPINYASRTYAPTYNMTYLWPRVDTPSLRIGIVMHGPPDVIPESDIPSGYV